MGRFKKELRAEIYCPELNQMHESLFA